MSRHRAGRVVSLLLALTLAWLVDCAYQRTTGPLSVQSLKNLNFVTHARRGSLREALAEHPRVRPPFYPLVLHAGARLGLRPRRTNELLLGGVLVLVYLLARRTLMELHPLWPTALFALLHCNYVAAHQFTAEALYVLLSLALLLLLATGPPLGARLWDLGLVAAALAVTRSFALLTYLPLCGLHVLSERSGGRLRRAGRTLLYCGMALTPAMAWMAFVLVDTGYVTGAPRFSARALPSIVSHWRELSGFWPALTLFLRTLFTDFFSLDSYAALSVVTRPLHPHPAELLAALLGLVTLGVTLRALGPELLCPRAPASLCFQFFLTYVVTLLLLATFSNNDPIYSRFLWPSYVFLVLLIAYGYGALVRQAAPRRWRWLLWAFAAALGSIQLTRHIVAPVLPYR